MSDEATALPPGPISRRTMSSDGRFAVANTPIEYAPVTATGCGFPQPLAPSAVLPEIVPVPFSPSAACLTSLERNSTSPVRASTNERYARTSPPSASRTIVSNAGRTPCVKVGNATRRERWSTWRLVPGTAGVASPLAANSVQPSRVRTPVTSAPEARTPALAAARSQPSTGLSVAPAGAACEPAAEEETYATRPPDTPTVIMPSWPAGRPPKRCRNSTACPSLPASFASLTRSRASTSAADSRNSSRWSLTKARATPAALPAEAPVRNPSPAISEAGVP